MHIAASVVCFFAQYALICRPFRLISSRKALICRRLLFRRKAASIWSSSALRRKSAPSAFKRSHGRYQPAFWRSRWGWRGCTPHA